MANPTQHRLNAIELRVLGCLLEKQRTTPDQYPLSLNSLRLACNQSTNREPVMSLDEDEVRDAVHSLSSAGWARLASGAGSRAAKYRQLFDESLDLLPSESSLLAMLFLRGPQTVNELRTRTARAHAFADNDEVAETLGRLAETELVRELPREPGQRETRWTHLLAAEERAAPTLEDVIDAYNEAWNRHDLDAIVALHAPGMVFQNYNAGERAEGDAVRSAHRADLRELARPPLHRPVALRRRRLRRAGVDGARDAPERHGAHLGGRRPLPVQEREDPAQGRLLERLAPGPGAARELDVRVR